MNKRPTRLFTYFLCLIVTSFLLTISCSKDTDTLLDAVLNEEEVPIIEQDSLDKDEIEEQPDENGEQNGEDSDEQINDETDFESRTTIFPTINDAYLQSGKGYNQELVRLQENFRRSYLMFDLSPIDSIGGNIISASLEFIVNTDDGNGIVRVFKGTSSDWSENNLSEQSAPETIAELGNIEQVFNVGIEVEIGLETSELSAELATLILEHEDGNDLAFASKENKTMKGPKLVVTYNAPVASETIVVEDNQVLEDPEEDSTEEDTTEEDTTEDDSTEDDDNEDNTSEDDTTNEDAPEDDSTGDDTTEDDSTEEETNSSPTALAEATPVTGVVPLEVSFSSNTSSDDKGIVSYEWNFKNGSTATSPNPSHTFTEPGSYAVTLQVTDAEGLTSTDTVAIVVSAQENNAPMAIASADVTVGEAPLHINFMGSNSTDDQAINRYEWNFKDGSTSNEANPSHTFNTPGVYNVDLFVYDAQGLSDFAEITITVEERMVVDNSCSTISTARSTEGFKRWCWADLAGDVASANALDSFTGGNLYRSAHYQDSGTYVQDGRLHFNLIANASSLDYRQEIRTDAYTVLPSNTEEWIGYNVKFDDDYVPDINPWVMTQFKIESSSGNGQPMISLQPLPANHGGLGNALGEIAVVNAAVNQPSLDNVATGIVPVAGGSYDIVMHIVWGDASNGRFRLWINGSLVYDKQQRVLYASEEEVGYWKVGIYQANWRNTTQVNNSIANGTSELHISIGNIRQIMRKPTHVDYAKNGYNTVAPQ